MAIYCCGHEIDEITGGACAFCGHQHASKEENLRGVIEGARRNLDNLYAYTPEQRAAYCDRSSPPGKQDWQSLVVFFEGLIANCEHDLAALTSGRREG
jgi:hypothetical protein